MQVVRASGLEVAYERVGEGTPLVFVHGAALDGRMWQPQLAALADEFTVVVWDEPGAGRSSDVPAEFGLSDYADCLAALIDALALGPAHVAGLSWGGTVVPRSGGYPREHLRGLPACPEIGPPLLRLQPIGCMQAAEFSGRGTRPLAVAVAFGCTAVAPGASTRRSWG